MSRQPSTFHSGGGMEGKSGLSSRREQGSTPLHRLLAFFSFGGSFNLAQITVNDPFITLTLVKAFEEASVIVYIPDR